MLLLLQLKMSLLKRKDHPGQTPGFDPGFWEKRGRGVDPVSTPTPAPCLDPDPDGVKTPKKKIDPDLGGVKTP